MTKHFKILGIEMQLYEIWQCLIDQNIHLNLSKDIKMVDTWDTEIKMASKLIKNTNNQIKTELVKAKKHNIFVQIIRKIKISFLKIYYARGSSYEIALGAAIGAFWGVFPTFGLSTPLVIIMYRFMKFNLIAAFSGAFISNPLTSPFWLFFSYKIGALFIHSEVTFDLSHWTENLRELGLTMLVGSLLLSSITAIIIFFLTKYLIEKRRHLTSIANQRLKP